MRHKRKFNHLSRKAGHRNAMLSNMATSLIMHKRIFTTVAKAKALRQYVEPVITKAKEDTTHSRRVVFGLLQNKAAVTELFQNVSQKVADRPGGYTRIIKTGFRLGDNAAMCFIELVDYNENMLSDTSKKRTRTRRSRRRKSSDASKATVDSKAQETTKSEKVDEAKQPKTDEAPKKEAATKVKEEAAAENKKPEKVEEVSKEEKQEIKEDKKAESIEAKADTHNPGTDDNKDVPLPRDNA